MTTKYELTATIPARLVGPIVELLDSEGIHATTKPVDRPAHKTFHRRRRHPATSPESAANQTLLAIQSGCRKPEQIEQFLVARGFSINTAGPRLSQLSKIGLIVRKADGYHLAEKKTNAHSHT